MHAAHRRAAPPRGTLRQRRPTEPDDARPGVAARQAGVFTGAQAVEAGASRRQVERRLESGAWVRLAGRGLVVASADPVITVRRLAWAGHLTYPDAVVGGHLAAAVHAFPVEAPDVVQMFADRARTGWTGGAVPITARRPGVPVEHTVWLGPLPVTDRRRTAVDCLAAMGWEAALNLYAWLVTRGVLDHAGLCAAIRERLDRPGTSQLRRLAAATRHGALSAAEHRLHALLRSAGLRGWRANVAVEDQDGVIGVVDVLFEAAGLVIEVDGLAAHTGRDAFQRDRRRQNRLVNARFRVLRFTWWDLTERPEAVLAEIVRALAPSASPA